MEELNKIKKLALEAVLLSMGDIKSNLDRTIDREEVKANAEAMLCLATAFEKIWTVNEV